MRTDLEKLQERVTTLESGVRNKTTNECWEEIQLLNRLFATTYDLLNATKDDVDLAKYFNGESLIFSPTDSELNPCEHFFYHPHSLPANEKYPQSSRGIAPYIEQARKQ